MAEASDVKYKENYDTLKSIDEEQEQAELETKAKVDADAEKLPSYENYVNNGSDEEQELNSHVGGAKKFVLTYTPTKKHTKNKKRKTKRNRIFRNN